MKRLNLIWKTCLMLAFVGCETENISDVSSENIATQKSTTLNKFPQNVFGSNEWTSGTLPNTGDYNKRIVSPEGLKFLRFDKEHGAPLVVSNNPEAVHSDGWLMQTSDKGRGSKKHTFSNEKTRVYIFHYNRAWDKKGLYVHLLVSNPSANPLQVSSKGKMYSKDTPPGVAGSGPSYAVSEDWIKGNLDIKNSPEISQFKMHEVAKIFVPYNKFVDGLFELDIKGDGLVYIVATKDGKTDTAIRLSQTKQAPGKIVKPSANEFGRSAGVYIASEHKGTTTFLLPEGKAYIGACFNTTNKFDKNLQELSPGAWMTLFDSSPLLYGMYGMHFDQNYILSNRTNRARTVKLYIASNNHVDNSGVRRNQLTYNGEIKLNGVAFKTVALRGDNPKQELAHWTIPANKDFHARIEGYFPGLLTAGQQIIIETTN